MKEVNKYEWRKFRYLGKGGVDQGAHIIINSDKIKTGASFHADLIHKIFPNAKFVEVFYDGEGYMGFKFNNSTQKVDNHRLTKASRIRMKIGSSVFSKFESLKYFEKDVQIDAKNKIAIIKTELKKDTSMEDSVFRG